MGEILHVIESLNDHGGTPLKLLYLAEHWRDRSRPLAFYVYRPSNLRSRFEAAGATVQQGDSTNSVRIVKDLMRRIAAQGVDVICTHFPRPLLCGAVAGRIAGCPFIHFEHSSTRYRGAVVNLVVRALISRAVTVVCNSRHTLASVRDRYALRDDRLLAMPDPVVPRPATLEREAARRELGIAPDEFLIAHVGGMIEERDQAILLRAVGELCGKGIEARLALAGDGPCRLELESQAAALGIAGNVHFLGYTDAVGDLLAAADVYVNPTLDEGFGIAVVEAMYAALPVIASDAGAHPELIQDGVTGWLYPPRDLDALVRLLIRVAERDVSVESVRLAGRRAAAGFGPEFYVDRFESIVSAALRSVPE